MKTYGQCDCCGKTITNVWDYSSEYDNGIKTYCLNCSFRKAYKRLSVEYLKPMIIEERADKMTKKVQIELILRDMENSLSILREAETFEKRENIPGLAKRLEESAKTIVDMYSEENEKSSVLQVDVDFFRKEMEEIKRKTEMIEEVVNCYYPHNKIRNCNERNQYRKHLKELNPESFKSYMMNFYIQRMDDKAAEREEIIKKMNNL